MISNSKINIARVNLGNSLMKKRLALSVSKSELQRITGLHRDTINDIENATGDIRLSSYLIYEEGLKQITNQLCHESNR
jgi:hypothetical protein